MHFVHTFLKGNEVKLHLIFFKDYNCSINMHVAVTATLHRFHCVFTRTQIHGATFVHGQSVHRRMAFYNLLGDPTATNTDVVALLAMWYSQT